MRRVYEALHAVEAHMIAHLLQQADLRAEVVGEHLQSGAGELPLGSLVAVVVPDEQVEESRQIIREWEARNRSGERSSESAKKTSTMGAFLAGAILSGGLVWGIDRISTQTLTDDLNGDGAVDTRYFYENELLVRSETDRNFDDRMDQISVFEPDLSAKTMTDDDFDGTFEGTSYFVNDRPERYVQDADQDGRPEYREHYVHGVLHTSEYFSQSGRLVKKVMYKGTEPERAELDLDGDGIRERWYTFDEYDEPVGR